MPHLSSVGLVDLVVLGVVVVAAVGALRRGRGLLPAVGAGIGALLVCWLGLVAVSAWGPPRLAGEVRSSAFAHTFAMPDAALDDLARLTGTRPDGPGRP